MQVSARSAAPTKMIAHPGRARATNEGFELGEIRPVGGRRAADPEGHAVLHDAVRLEDAIEVVAGFAARDHEVFADDLEEVERRAILQNGSVVRDAKPD